MVRCDCDKEYQHPVPKLMASSPHISGSRLLDTPGICEWSNSNVRSSVHVEVASFNLYDETPHFGPSLVLLWVLTSFALHRCLRVPQVFPSHGFHNLDGSISPETN